MCVCVCVFVSVQPVNWRKKFPEADPLAIDLMSKMMAFDPRKRITVTEALAHPWLAQLHDPALEPSAPGKTHTHIHTHTHVCARVCTHS